ncbi:helix-turn-helix domain-containing protein, partial [Lentzea albida]
MTYAADNPALAAEVRRLRKEKGWSAQRLADECARQGSRSLTRSTIAKIESGVRRSVTAPELAVLARALGVSAGYLLGETTESSLTTVRPDSSEIVEFFNEQSRLTPHERINSPASLLSAHQEIVPFQGREEVFAALHEWSSRPGFGIFLIYGSGGQGKTRLARSFSRDLADKGWLTGWPNRTYDDSSLTALTNIDQPMLLVIDYAEAQIDLTTSLIGILGRKKRPSPSAKVLLLARSAGAWWDSVAEYNELTGDYVDTAVVLHLQPLAKNGAEQAASYKNAALAFSSALGLLGALPDDSASVTAKVIAEAPSPLRPDSTILEIQAAALADLLDAARNLTPAVSVYSDGLTRAPVDRLLDHERRYWNSTAQAESLLTNLSLATLTDAVAAAMLLGPTTADALTSAIARVPGMADQPYDRLDAVASWLAQLYPPAAGRFVDTLPDSIVERLIGRLILERPGTFDRLASTANGDEAVHFLTVCARTAKQAEFKDQMTREITTWCRQYPSRLLLAAITAASRVEFSTPLVEAINEAVLQIELHVDDLRILSAAIPSRTLALAETAVLLTQAEAALHRTEAAHGHDELLPYLAESLNNVAVRLGKLGRAQEALTAIHEAVQTYRSLAEAQPDAYLPDLA